MDWPPLHIQNLCRSDKSQALPTARMGGSVWDVGRGKGAKAEVSLQVAKADENLLLQDVQGRIDEGIGYYDYALAVHGLLCEAMASCTDDLCRSDFIRPEPRYDDEEQIAAIACEYNRSSDVGGEALSSTGEILPTGVLALSELFLPNPSFDLASFLVTGVGAGAGAAMILAGGEECGGDIGWDKSGKGSAFIDTGSNVFFECANDEVLLEVVLIKPDQTDVDLSQYIASLCHLLPTGIQNAELGCVRAAAAKLEVVLMMVYKLKQIK
ncbi:hypothetical protein BDZ97DRAFT_1764515 [Flammula alnicola]|nr:hypothetical protein BDZ97DRAFT_1764515 [Flammula alnicola]